MEWDDLRFVLAIHRHGSLSLAAAALDVSHTTVGRRVRALEEKLGVRLFDRTPDAFVPTAAGLDVAEVAERMEGDVLRLEGRVLGRDSQLRGVIRMTTMDILVRRYRDVIASFSDRFPSVELTVSSSDTKASLSRREADVALRLSSSPPENLVGRKLGRVEFAVYASLSLADRVGAGATYSDFPWIGWDSRLEVGKWHDGWLARHAPGARVVLRVDMTSFVLRELLAAGTGVHFLATFEGDADPRLRRVGPIEAEHGRDVWLLTLPELRRTNRIRALLDHFDDHVRAEKLGSRPRRR